MAGSIQLSGSQQFDSQGRPLSGGLLYFFASGTTTPQNAFQDQALAIPYPNPIVLDASGRVPFFYLADGNIKIRLTDSTGVVIIAADGLLVIGPSSGGGGGGSVDPTTILATGDVKARYGTGTVTGFVRCNGRTLGSATSGATEFANASAQALFEYLWAADPNLVVSSGRGGSANADWVANKTITLPDMRGRTIAGMDDMGGAAAGRLTVAGLGVAATALGAAGGTETHALTSTTQLPPYTPSGSVAVANSASGTLTYTPTGSVAGNSTGNNSTNSGSVPAWMGTDGVGGGLVQGISSATFTGNPVNFSGSFTGNAVGASAPFATMAPAMVMTFYMKL